MRESADHHNRTMIERRREGGYRGGRCDHQYARREGQCGRGDSGARASGPGLGEEGQQRDEAVAGGRVADPASRERGDVVVRALAFIGRGESRTTPRASSKA